MKRLSNVVLVIAIVLLALRVNAQPCTPPLFQGYPNSCSTINLRWLNRDSISLIDHYDILRYGQRIGVASANAISYSDPVGCGFGAIYTIRQVMRSGASCDTITNGPNPPHTSPCDLCSGGGNTSPISVVRAPDSGAFMTPNSIATIYGSNFTSGFQFAASLPLPTTLAGVSVRVNGLPAGLFFVNHQQINFLIPDVLIGQATVEVFGTDGLQRATRIDLFANRPGVFTENQQGNGPAAANYLRFDGDPGSVYAVIWATGITDFNRLNTRLRCGSTITDIAPQWIGLSGYAGLVQANFRLPLSLAGSHINGCQFLTNGTVSNSFDLRP